MLTQQKALQRLQSGPLVFGDPRLIEAHEFLQQIEMAKEIIREQCKCGRCPQCDGSGLIRYADSFVCRTCDGFGAFFAAIRADAVIQARRKIGRRKP